MSVPTPISTAQNVNPEKNVESPRFNEQENNAPAEANFDLLLNTKKEVLEKQIEPEQDEQNKKERNEDNSESTYNIAPIFIELIRPEQLKSKQNNVESIVSSAEPDVLATEPNTEKTALMYLSKSDILDDLITAKRNDKDNNIIKRDNSDNKVEGVNPTLVNKKESHKETQPTLYLKEAPEDFIKNKPGELPIENLNLENQTKRELNLSILTEKQNGTLVAQSKNEMIKQQDIDKFAELTKQNFPVDTDFGETNGVADNANLEEKVGKSVQKEAFFLNPTSNQEPRKMTIDYVMENETTVKIDVKNISQKIMDEIKPHILTLRQHTSNELTLKLTPDSETELSIRMVLNGNKIIATAWLEKGDWYLLKSQWQELQNSLSKYDVELGSLYIGQDSSHNQRRWEFNEFHPDLNVRINTAFVNRENNDERLNSQPVYNGWECWA